MTGLRKFLCPSGHDKRVTGIRENHACRECSREYNRKRRLDPAAREVDKKSAAARITDGRTAKSQARYNGTDKRKASNRRYNQSSKGKARTIRAASYRYMWRLNRQADQGLAEKEAEGWPI